MGVKIDWSHPDYYNYMRYSLFHFVPLRYGREELDVNQLSSTIGKTMQYASCGKAALYHCLNSLGLKSGDMILIPNYVCDSILKPIKKLGLQYVFYDINTSDLNANVIDIQNRIENNPLIRAVLVASMYGNPAELSKLEAICKEKSVFLIDDGAQSFGSMINKRYVGSFGDAGFFSFSRAKATPGHLGAFFWTSKTDYRINRTHHYLYHKMAYLSYYFNSYELYRYYRYRFFILLNYLTLILYKLVDWWNDDICNFERPILGGVLKANSKQTFRTEFASQLYAKFQNNPFFSVITKGLLFTNNHKLVLLFNDLSDMVKCSHYLDSCGIYTSGGYHLLNREADTPIAKSIEGKVLEIPLENDRAKFENLVARLDCFIQTNIKSDNNLQK